MSSLSSLRTKLWNIIKEFSGLDLMINTLKMLQCTVGMIPGLIIKQMEEKPSYKIITSHIPHTGVPSVNFKHKPNQIKLQQKVALIY
jgi:hypothetical protein